MEEETENSLSNGGSFEAIDGNNIDAALFSKEDLTLNGTGSLTVTSPAGHGVVSKDDLVITGGSISITAASHGLTAKDALNIAGGSFALISGKDGIHAENADLVIIAVGTPPHPVTKEADMKYIHAAATELAEHLTGYTVVANKSTVPVGTGDDVEALIDKKNPNADFDVISLPEFLREGFAVYDFFHPDRIVVGANTERARNVIKELYKPFEGKTQTGI